MFKSKRDQSGKWGKFLLFTCIVGLIVGFFSVVSDNLPSLLDGITVNEFVISYLAIMINSLPIWFILAMIAGNVFGRNIKEAALFGAIYTVIAITIYFIMKDLYESRSVSVPFKTSVEWYIASAAGGTIGGVIGYLVKKTPYMLIFLVAGLVLQLYVNGARSWSDAVGIAQNVTYCLLIVSIIVYLMIVKNKQRLLGMEN